MDHDHLKRQLTAIRGRINRLLEELDEDTTSEPAQTQPQTDWEPTDEITWQQLSGAFARRYQAARGLAWTSGPHVQALIDIADALNIQPGDRKAHAKTVLDNFFADEYAKKAGFPPGLLSKQFGRYLKPPEEDGKPDRTLQALKAQEAERRYQQAKARAEAEHAEKVRQKAAEGRKLAAEGFVTLEDVKQALKGTE